MAIERLGVVGAGTMGAGIAEVSIGHGFSVVLYDVEERIVAGSHSRIRGGLERRARREGSAVDPAALLEHLTLTTRLEDVAAGDVVIEAAPEDLTLKRDLFARLDTLAPSTTILASNTSSLSITALAAATSHQERVVGMHFFNPATVMALVEVIPGAHTSAETVEAALALARALGKTPVRAKDTPGFIVNRVARPFYLEALRLLGEGRASVEEIDRIMRLAGGFRMGPFELLDLIGLDVNLAVTKSIYEASGHQPRFRPHPLQEEMVETGLLGRKAGRGFYAYEKGEHSATNRSSPLPPPPSAAGSRWVIVVGAGTLANEFQASAGIARWTAMRLKQTDARNLPPEEVVELLVEGLREAVTSRDEPPARSLQEADAAVEFYMDLVDKEFTLSNFAIGLGSHAVWVSLALETPLADLTPTLQKWLGPRRDGSPRFHPRRVVGFATLPPWGDRRLVEILPGPLSGPDAVSTVRAMFHALGKETAVVTDGAGGVFPRILAMIVNEAALALTEDVASPADIDTAMRLGANYPQGPLALADDVGLDVLLKIMEVLGSRLGEDVYRPAPLLKELVAAGWTGRAAGRGFYEHGTENHG